MVSRPPSVDALAAALDDGSLPRALLVEVARRSIESWRAAGEGPDPETLAASQLDRLRRLRPRRVINATGVLLHTNLGRAPMAREAVETAAASAAAATPLEFDLASGRRGRRGAFALELATTVTGAEAALIVNNNAGALYLTIAALAGSGAVVVSRGEQIEIGGSFRLPDLMAATGARMLEVGTTNRTRIEDYRRACGPETALLLKVHPSNYRVEGFVSEVGYHELASLAGESGIPFAADVGSGLLDARVPWIDGPPPAWLAEEPAVRQTLEDGADLVMFSGDKLLGGPQAGIAVGRADLIGRMAKHPVARALRIDGPRLDAVAVTLEMYAAGRAGELPFWRAATTSAAALEERCRRIIDESGVEGAEIAMGVSLPGAGSVPGKGIPGPVVVIPDPPHEAWRALLDLTPPIVARRDDRGLVIDPRSVEPADDGAVATGLAATCRS
jgi:L-seryl-tRNA(Ser) seleniumtransferase